MKKIEIVRPLGKILENYQKRIETIKKILKMKLKNINLAKTFVFSSEKNR